LPARWYSPHLLPWLRANRHRFDGILVHGLWEYTGLAARLAAGGLPVVVFPHGMLDPYFKRAARGKHLKKLLYWLLVEFWNLRAAHRVLFTTERERELAAHTFRPASWRDAVCALGTEPAVPDTPELRTAFYARCPEVEGKRFLLFLGRIDPKKGCDLLLQAFDELAAAQPELHLVLAGPLDSTWATALRDRAQGLDCATRIHFPGMLAGAAKAGALAACAAFVLPSHQENFGIAVVEALAAGRPVLVSDQVNIAPQVAAAGCGLVEPDTLEGTRNLLTRWLALTDAEDEALSARALQAFTKHFDIRANAAPIFAAFATTPQPAAAPGRPLPEAR
jgi:glycosyltransferase involved in cell wall biosynthesis